MNDIIKITKVSPAVIDYDIKKIEQDCQFVLSEYESRIASCVEPDDFKELRVEINKIIKNVNDRAKEIDKMLSEPIKDFREFIKTQLKPFDTMSELCKLKVDEATTKYQESKMQEIMTLTGWDYFIKFNGVNLAWVNKTYSMKQIQEDINLANDFTDGKIKTIDSLFKDYGLPNRDRYINMVKDYTIDKITEKMLEDKELLKAGTATVSTPTDETDRMVFATIHVKGKQSKLKELRKWCEKNDIYLDIIESHYKEEEE